MMMFNSEMMILVNLGESRDTWPEEGAKSLVGNRVGYVPSSRHVTS